MAKNYFLTGTDTDCGKTLVASALLQCANIKGLRTLGLKPIAAGSHLVDGKPRNDDALQLIRYSSVKLPYAQVNPVLFDEEIAPHIAAEKNQRSVTISQLEGFMRGALMTPADFRIIEGAGGWLVPVNRREPLSELPKRLKTDVIVVVGMKLGCINHAMLTIAAITRDGLKIAGWVANQIDADMHCFDENLSTLQQIIPAPCLGVVPFIKEGELVEMAAACLSLPE